MGATDTEDDDITFEEDMQRLTAELLGLAPPWWKVGSGGASAVRELGMASTTETLVLGHVCSKIGSGATPKGGKEAGIWPPARLLSFVAKMF